MNSTINNGSMHEMLFEKRNKAYGAYAIRTAYNDTVVKSLAIVASALLLVIGGTWAYNSLFAEKVSADEQAYVDWQERVITINCPIETPKMPEDKNVYRPATAAMATVIQDEVPEDPEKKNLPLSMVASAEIAGDTLEGEPLSLASGQGGNGGLPPVVPEELMDTVIIADTMPVYVGGNTAMKNFLARNIVYPERSKLLGSEGTVYINFVVDASGRVVKCKVVKGIDEDCNEEALRVVSKMPRWKPGKNGKKAVPVMFNIPIHFQLD